MIKIVSQSLVQNYETSILNAKSKQNVEVTLIMHDNKFSKLHFIPLSHV